MQLKLWYLWFLVSVPLLGVTFTPLLLLHGSKAADFILVVVSVRANCQHLESFPERSMKFIMLILSSFPPFHPSSLPPPSFRIHLGLLYTYLFSSLVCSSTLHEFLLYIAALRVLDTISLFSLLSQASFGQLQVCISLVDHW